MLHEHVSFMDSLLASSSATRPAAGVHDAGAVRSWLNELGSTRLMYLMR